MNQILLGDIDSSGGLEGWREEGGRERKTERLSVKLYKVEGTRKITTLVHSTLSCK